MISDSAIYGVHAAFWSSFAAGRWLLGPRKKDRARKAERAATAPYARTLVIAFGASMGVMYFGIGDAVIGRKVPELFFLQRAAGTAVIAAGAVVACWALASFGSWRIQAKIDAGHRLATGGPFAFVRHPIYLALDLLVIGTLLWIPSWIELAAAAFAVLVGDLRARAEEKILLASFGQRYRDYMRTSSRFVPGIY